MDLNTHPPQDTDQGDKKSITPEIKNGLPEIKKEEVKAMIPDNTNFLIKRKRKYPARKQRMYDDTSDDMNDDENISEKELEDRMLRLNLGLNELCSTPILLMGLFDMLFENIPQPVKVQFKDVGITINTYFLTEVDVEHKDLIKYLINKIK